MSWACLTALRENVQRVEVSAVGQESRWNRLNAEARQLAVDGDKMGAVVSLRVLERSLRVRRVHGSKMLHACKQSRRNQLQTLAAGDFAVGLLLR